MLVEIPDLEIMIPVVKEKRRLQSVRPTHLSQKIIDGNITKDGYTWKNITDEEVKKTPLHFLWGEYEASFNIPPTKEAMVKCVLALKAYADFEVDYTYESLMKSSLECVYATYTTLRTNATIPGGRLPGWKKLIEEYEGEKTK